VSGEGWGFRGGGDGVSSALLATPGHRCEFDVTPPSTRKVDSTRRTRQKSKESEPLQGATTFHLYHETLSGAKRCV